MFYYKYEAPRGCSSRDIEYRSKFQDMLRNLNRSAKEATRKLGVSDLHNVFNPVCSLTYNTNLFNTSEFGYKLVQSSLG